MERPQHIEALAPTRDFDPTAGEAPEVPQKRAEDNMGSLPKKDCPLTGLRFGQARFQLLLLILFLCLRIGFGRQHPSLEAFQTQLLEK